MIRTLASLAVAVAGCTGPAPSSCDQSAIVGLTETLEREASTPGAETRAIAALAAACPRLDPGFVQSLRDRYVYERVQSLAVYDGLPGARRRVCADPEAWVGQVPVAPAERRPRIVFDACGFARLGVLDEGEQLLGDDNEVLFVVATLDRDGVERALLRRLGRALMTGVAPLPVARRRCAELPGSDACTRLLQLAGVDPAPSTVMRDGLREEPRLLLSPRALLWTGETIAEHDRGALPAADVEGHGIVPLATAVATWTTGRGEQDRERLAVAPDRGLAFGIVIDALYTATRGGVEEFALIGRGKYALVTIPVATPRAWLPSSHARRDVLDGPVATIDESVVSVTLGASETTLSVHASAALTALAAQWRGAAPHRDGTIHVRVTRATRVDAVVAVLDALRGPECPYLDDGIGCLLSRPILDQEPPIEAVAPGE
ncbi:hypothetical protein [Nannocystis punicea]|uniref:Uncharacterized protein n=1 Tax=Nannocystis punicea TaxID=2995304 RepID=A0ABY7H9M3_9BACT|nr:hypothetical protein [Nannocystis poenicansa]WAS95795.1 hypothetical protein O0S08_06495 [Nannocystis poenicansa]